MARRATNIASAMSILLALATTADARPIAKPRGWSNPQAFSLAKEGIEAKQSGDSQLCVTKDQESLALEDHPYVRLHLSSCHGSLGKLRDALKAASEALAAGMRLGDAELVAAAETRVKEILPRLAHIKLLVPKSTTKDSSPIKVVVNGIPVRPTSFDRRIAMDPGDYVVDASRTEKGERYEFHEAGTLAEGEDKTIAVAPRRFDACPTLEQCLREAATEESKLECVRTCVDEKTTKPAYHAGVELSGYTDSTSVQVVSPAINVAISSPTEGWNVGASYLVDVVSAASPDIVSMASPRFREVRHAGSVGGGAKLGDLGAGVTTGISREPDYVSLNAGGSLSVELFDKMVVPRVLYGLTYDRIGIRDTPFDQFERNMTTHEIQAGATLVLSPTTLLVIGGTGQIERGEHSKLYRFVPMFTPRDASNVSPGEPIDSVNLFRQPVRPRERLPQERDRVALAARLNHRIGNATLRLEERIYTDTWNVNASTTDGRYLVDLGTRLRVWPHLRFHGQTGASFYKLAYTAELDEDGRLVGIDRYRTGDRELSPMIQITAGGGVRLGLTSENASTRLALVLSGDVMWGRYFQSLFIKTRTAIYGTIGFEVEL